ncbi:MAG: Bug family tripartite tricarboxylate transporter substrate binding protein [Comamonas sp.]
MQRRHFLSLGGSAALAAAPWPALAQSGGHWPAKPVRIVIPYVAGGVTDSVGRRLCDQLAKALGQPLVVDNKAGAGGTLGMAEVARAQPDGYTLALSAISPVTLSPHLMKLPYDPLKDIAAVAPMMYSPVYVLATPAFTGKSWDDLIAQARAKPDSIRFATSGIGSVGHIMLEQIQARLGVRMIHVPYKGVGQTVNDAAGGHFEIMLGNPFGTINGLLQQGTLRLLATTGPQRAPNQPQAATLAELGVPEANLTSLFGFMAPGKTPPAIIGQLVQAIHAQLQQDDIRQLMRSTDNVPLQLGAQEFAQLLRDESRNNAAIIEKANIRL